MRCRMLKKAWQYRGCTSIAISMKGVEFSSVRHIVTNVLWKIINKEEDGLTTVFK